MKWTFEDGHIYSLDSNNTLMAETTYNLLESGVVDIDHTYVSPDHRGQGIAGKMMEVVVEYFRTNNFKIYATCPYAKAWLEKNKTRFGEIMVDIPENSSK